MFKKYVADLRHEFRGYNGRKLSQDLMSGLTVAAVALPLALAFGVSSGADAASGLITAIVAGLLIGAFSGASYQISGPTGAMTAILLSLSTRYGLEGVFTAGVLSGAILILAAVFKIGKLVSYIPGPVITGFTSGIAIIIALGQIDNFFGTASTGDSAVKKLLSYGSTGFSPQLQTMLFGLIAIAVMVFYPKKLNAKFPSSLAAIIIALIVQLILGLDVAEVGAIPKTLFPEHRLQLSQIDFANIKHLISPAVSIAALGMIESLLCGASAGKMKNEKLDAQRELVAQGIGNMIIPFFGGVPATAAIARTSVAIKSGGHTRLVSVFHSATLVASMFLLGPVMSRIPLSALAGVLMVTAWRMNDWSSIKNMFSKKLKNSGEQFFITMAATVVFDLTTAIVIGVVLSMLIFIVKSCELSVCVSDVDSRRLSKAGHDLAVPLENTKLVYLTGPLFFGTQDKLTAVLGELDDADSIVFSMRGVPMIDDSAIAELEMLFDRYTDEGVSIMFSGVQERVKNTMRRAGFVDNVGEDSFCWDAVSAISLLEKKYA
ncbi:MAG: SulP family inorganic anion transporter [Oscillospiraceae bacterium]|nr:SulP family inorganic anion transporter [Oscillospiraceae bacterium]